MRLFFGSEIKKRGARTKETGYREKSGLSHRQLSVGEPPQADGLQQRDVPRQAVVAPLRHLLQCMHCSKAVQSACTCIRSGCKQQRDPRPSLSPEASGAASQATVGTLTTVAPTPDKWMSGLLGIYFGRPGPLQALECAAMASSPTVHRLPAPISCHTLHTTNPGIYGYSRCTTCILRCTNAANQGRVLTYPGSGGHLEQREAVRADGRSGRLSALLQKRQQPLVRVRLRGRHLRHARH